MIRNKWWWHIGLVMSLMLVARGAGAVKYLSIEEAVKRFVPSGSKIVKVRKTLTAEQKKILQQSYGWQPTEDRYSFFAGKDTAGNRTAYVFIQPEIFNTCFHKFAIGLKPDGEVIDTVIVELSCPRATPINRRSFLKQFHGKRHSDPLTTYKDVDAVTGATLSSEVAAQATRKAVSLHNLLFGSGAPAKVPTEVARARAAGTAKIQHAIDTKETADSGE